MTLAAVSINPVAANELLHDFRVATGLRTELKGSRINLDERALFLELFRKAGAKAIIGLAITALTPRPGADRGDHDQKVYEALIDDVIGAWLPQTGGCAQIIMDDGRYDQFIMSRVRAEVAEMLGGFGTVRTEMSHHLAGLQIADVIANSFYNRARVSDRQTHFISLLQPHLDEKNMRMRILEKCRVQDCLGPEYDEPGS
jgi:hypothetical protein